MMYGARTTTEGLRHLHYLVLPVDKPISARQAALLAVCQTSAPNIYITTNGIVRRLEAEGVDTRYIGEDALKLSKQGLLALARQPLK